MRLNWLANGFNQHEGYGRYGMHMIRALANEGVHVQPALRDMALAPSWLQRMAGFSMDWSALTISCMYGSYLPSLPGRHWGMSMYEDTRIPKAWPSLINRNCERLIVPCEHNAEVFEREGVTIPIHVVHGGTDPVEFPLLPQVQRDQPYTFICLGDRGPRKGVETAWSAFFTAFPDQTDVRLLIKTRAEGLPGFGENTFTDKRVSLWKADLDTMAEVYAQADVFVYPAYGDGWGMPPREAAMMGIPTIATRWSGLEVGIDCWALPVDRYHMQRSTLPSEGEWAVPDVAEVARIMRWCYDNREEAHAKGIAAAAWLREHQTWQHSARQLISLIERYG